MKGWRLHPVHMAIVGIVLCIPALWLWPLLGKVLATVLLVVMLVAAWSLKDE